MAHALVLQWWDNRIVAVGVCHNGNDCGMGATRDDSDGSLDAFDGYGGGLSGETGHGFTVTVLVPEPSGVLLLGLAAVVVLVGRRRRRERLTIRKPKACGRFTQSLRTAADRH